MCVSKLSLKNLNNKNEAIQNTYIGLTENNLQINRNYLVLTTQKSEKKSSDTKFNWSMTDKPTIQQEYNIFIQSQ